MRLTTKQPKSAQTSKNTQGSETITLRLPADLKRKFEQVCHEEDLSVSRTTRHLIRQYVNQYVKSKEEERSSNA